MFHKIQLDFDNPKTVTLAWPGKLVYIILAATFVGLVILQLILSNHLATQGSKLYDLRLTEKELIDQNLILRKQAAEKSSLSEIGKRAKDLNMVKASKFLYVSKTTPLAQIQ